MPIHANMYSGPAVHPTRGRPLIPDRPDPALEQNHGWLCDERVMSCHNYKIEGNTAIEGGQYGRAEILIHAEIEQAEQIGSLNPRLAGSLNQLGILHAKQHKYKQAELLFQRSLGVCVAARGSDHPDVAAILKNIGILKAFPE